MMSQLCRVREAPHAMAHPDGLLDEVDDRRLPLLLVEDVVDDVCLVLVEAPDVLELRGGGLREPDPVLQRPLDHLLMGQDPSLLVVAQPHRADEPAHPLAARHPAGRTPARTPRRKAARSGAGCPAPATGQAGPGRGCSGCPSRCRWRLSLPRMRRTTLCGCCP